uniref:Uncharacterized protein n=1 Tax=Zea mays TaxID=4577 RepID=A0A804P977_MAIZE
MNSHQLGVADLIPGVGRHRIRWRIGEPRPGLRRDQPHAKNRAGEFLVVCFRRSRVPLVLYASQESFSLYFFSLKTKGVSTLILAKLNSCPVLVQHTGKVQLCE